MLIAAVVAVAAVAAYWMLVLTPKREQAATLSTSIAKQQGDLKAAETQVAGYEQAKAGYKANYTLVARLGKAVPADDDVRSLLVQLNSAADKSKVDFRKIAVGGGVAPAPVTPTKGAKPAAVPPPGSSLVGSAGFAQMPFTFSFKGSYFDLGKFFKRLDRFVAVKQQRLDVTGRLMVLDTVSLLPDATGFPNMRAQIGATTYMLPPAEGLTAGASAQGPGTATPATPAAAGASATPAPGATAAPSTPTAAIGANR
jgi:Tfp pilus assembly protein PilO